MDITMDITVNPPGHRSRQAEASLCQRRRPHSQSTTENQKLWILLSQIWGVDVFGYIWLKYGEYFFEVLWILLWNIGNTNMNIVNVCLKILWTFVWKYRGYLFENIVDICLKILWVFVWKYCGYLLENILDIFWKYCELLFGNIVDNFSFL